MSLGRKFFLAVVISVIGAMAILTLLITRRETGFISREFVRNAEVIATALSVAIHDNMLEGRAGDTLRLIDKLKRIEGVQELAVLKADGKYAFGLSGPSPGLPAGTFARLRDGEKVILSREGSHYLIEPLINSSQCRTCHPPGEKIRGILLVKMTSTGMLHSVGGLSRRMFGFGLVTALFLSGLLAVMGKQWLLSPIRALTEASRQITLGNYVLHKPRGTPCHEMLRCDRRNCPSHGETMIPCWLQSGTLCNGKPSGKFALQGGDCGKCRVYKEHRGDEIVQLQDNFNRMSLTLKRHERDTDEYIKKIEGLNRDTEISFFQTVIALSNAIEAKDPYTRGHSERVAAFCEKAAETMNLGSQEKKELRFAAILHDIGKIGIDRDLLRKKSGLSDDEECEIRSHPEWGVQILEPVHFLRPILSIIRHHHERFDGNGYPLGLKGKDIPLEARIICIADAWDAMRSNRPYRNALSVERAVEELQRNAGTQFDPEIVEVILDYFSTLRE